MAWHDITVSDDITLDFDVVHRITNSDHNELRNRDLPDQHPIEAITGLDDRLKGLEKSVSELEGTDTGVSEHISKIEQSVTDLEKSMVEADTQLTNSLTENVTQLERVITENVTALETSIKDNKADIEQLENAVAQNATDISELHDAVELIEDIKLDGEGMTNEEIQALWNSVMA